MAGNVKLMTSAGGGVVLDTATTTATDVTVKVPVTGVNNGTLVCSDSSGNVGIGTSSPLAKVHVEGNTSGAVQAFIKNANGGTNSSADLVFGVWSGTIPTGTGNPGPSAKISAINLNSADASTAIAFYTYAASGSSAERMRIDSSGNLLVGCTANPSSSVSGVRLSNPVANQPCAFSAGATTASTVMAYFINGNSVVGSIQTSGSSTSFVTSSDYRLKENIQPMQNALATVAQLNPVTYTWKADGSDGQGFIAHELQAVVPDCVTGEKDAVDSEGNPVYQGIDTSFLVATLTKAIQELSAKNDALEARLAALEAK